MSSVLLRLIESPEAYVAYNAAVLAGDGRAPALREGMLADPRVRSLVEELQGWPGPRLASHKSAQNFFHKLAFLADIGLTKGDPGVAAVLERALEHRDDRDIPKLPVEAGYAWALCDAPTTLYAAARMGGWTPGRRVTPVPTPP